MGNKDLVYDLVKEERARQDSLYADEEAKRLSLAGLWPTMTHLTVVLTEELGEVAKEVQEKNLERLTEELVQVAAVAVKMLEICQKYGSVSTVKDREMRDRVLGYLGENRVPLWYVYDFFKDKPRAGVSSVVMALVQEGVLVIDWEGKVSRRGK